MAHDHGYKLVLIKTPNGYLTNSGFTEDLCSKNIIILPLSSVGGKWAPIFQKINKFLKLTSISTESICDMDKWEVLGYSCDRLRNCGGCSDKVVQCDFWNDRTKVKLFRIY
jgi:hypothetical protein